MLNLVREREEDYIEAIRYRRRLKIFENFLFILDVTSHRLTFCRRDHGFRRHFVV